MQFHQIEQRVWAAFCCFWSPNYICSHEMTMPQTFDVQKEGVFHHTSLNAMLYSQIWYWFNLSWTLFPVLLCQIDHYAQRDLKKGLQLFGTEGNVGLTNAWMIVQTDVRVTITWGGGWKSKKPSIKMEVLMFFSVLDTVCWVCDALKNLKIHLWTSQRIQY